MRLECADNGLTIHAGTEADTERLGRALAAVVEPGTVIGLVGPLGAGKTRLVRAIAEALGADPAEIASPTFMLIHEYEARLPVYHFDVYRLKNADDFDALGPADYWSQREGVCLVEWADRVADRLPPGSWWITIEPAGPEARRFQLAFPAGNAACARLAALLDKSSQKQ